MRVRIALFCLFASLLAAAGFAAPGSSAPSTPVVSESPALSGPTLLLPEAGGTGDIVWQTLLTCDFKMELCASRCGGEVDCLTICYCAWYRCTGQPYPDYC